MAALEEGISGALDVLQEGEGFFRVVEGASRKPAIFTPEIVHNLLCMSIEKFSMAILLRLGDMPNNHTFEDLLFALKPLIPVSARIEEALLELDRETDLCSLEIRQARLPGPERMQMLVAIGARFRDAANAVVREGESFPLHLEAVD